MSTTRYFAVGDIHGMYDLLMEELGKVGFDKSTDKLICVGDLVDRGPDNERVVALLDEPWFTSIMGNHEELLLDAYSGGDEERFWHNRNGGKWFDDLDAETRRDIVHRVNALPYAITLDLPNGRRIGFVHADVHGMDWDQFILELDRNEVRHHACWSRDRIQGIRGWNDYGPIRNIDHVYLGHTILPNTLTHHNMTYLDTGGYSRGKLTVVEVR